MDQSFRVTAMDTARRTYFVARHLARISLNPHTLQVQYHGSLRHTRLLDSNYKRATFLHIRSMNLYHISTNQYKSLLFTTKSFVPQRAALSYHILVILRNAFIFIDIALHSRFFRRMYLST